MPHRPAALVALSALLLLSSCSFDVFGGGGGSSGTISLAGEPLLDGQVRSDGVAVADGGSPATGDLDTPATGVPTREFLSFSLAPIPAWAHVVRATLRVVQRTVVGAPYSTLGVVLVDHVDYGTSLDPGDFGLPALVSGLGPISSDPAPGERTLDVTAEVLADLQSGRLRSQFRLRFGPVESDADGTPDAVSIVDSELSALGAIPGDEPFLTVEFVE